MKSEDKSKFSLFGVGEGEMKPPAGLELIHLNTCLKGKRGCILNLIKIMIDDRKIVIFPFGKGGGSEGR